MRTGRTARAAIAIVIAAVLLPPSVVSAQSMSAGDGVGTPPRATAARALQPAQVARLDTALSAALVDLPGGIAAGVWVPGHKPWVAAVGEANMETGKPMTTNLQQPIGSVTKTFTGTLVMQEVERGTISLDDRLDRWYPNVPKADEITVAMLMNMSSGIADGLNDRFVEFLGDFAADPQQPFDPDELIATAAALPRAFDVPGSKYSYSNTNTVILGRILENVTGKPYAQLLKARLFAPLGLDRTFLFDSGSLQRPHAQTYTQFLGLLDDPPAESLTNVTSWPPSWGWSAGGIASTLGDLAAWGRALGTGDGVLARSTQRERLRHCTPVLTNAGLALRYEYCLGLVAVRDTGTGTARTIWHNGEVIGAVSYVGYYPITGAVVAVLANIDVADEHDTNLAMRTKTAIEAAVPGLLGLLPSQTRYSR